MTDLTHKWVKIHPRYFKFILNHLDAYEGPEHDWDTITNADIDIQLSLMSLMGVPISGFVKGPGLENCWQVMIMSGGLSDITYINRKDLILG